MNIGQNIHGFEVTRIRQVDEIGAEVIEMRHSKTGASLLWTKRDEKNKTFCIAFETLPEDSTGVFHILEHSVLNGSKKYPTKEPFVDLLKSSLNTFLNAMTYPDKTCYPVSSRNDADFMNLVRVYLDAVFQPAIYTQPNIFRQEGWHYELTDPAAEPIYKGVVFNEMKGAFSDPDTPIELCLDEMLFPDTPYRFVSGGDPEHIPELTYEQFIASHRRFYHPSNARIFFDGNVRIEELLEYIDAEYLSHYDYQAPDFKLEPQKPVEACARTCYRELAPDEDTAGKAHYARGKVVANFDEVERNLAIDALCDYLAGSNDAPLKREILKRGLAKDFELGSGGSMQTEIVLHARDMDESKFDELKATVRETLEKLLADGLDKEALNAVLNRMEFSYRERREPSGLMLGLRALQVWLYGGDPVRGMTTKDAFVFLHEALKGDYFENLLRETLLDEAHTAEVFMLPSTTIGAEKAEKEAARLREAKAAWSQEEIAELVKMNEQLVAWQQSEDTPEDKAKIPFLQLSQVPEQPEALPYEVKNEAGFTVVRTPASAEGIVYLHAYFALGQLTEQELSALAFMADLFGDLPTEHYDLKTLQREIKANLGSLTFSTFTAAGPEDTEHCAVYLRASFSVLEEKLPKALELLTEVLLRTDLRDKEHIREILMQNELTVRQEIPMQGLMYALRRIGATTTAKGYAEEQMHGYACYQWMKAFVADFDTRFESVAQTMETLRSSAVAAKRATFALSGKMGEADLAALRALLPEGEAVEINASWKRETHAREAIVIPAGISYAIIGSNLNRFGCRYNGTMIALSHLLTYHYLWNEVRVQGGAYGTGCTTMLNGDVFMHSYRDPDAQRSLGVYRRAADFLRKMCDANENIEQMLIGAIARTEPLLSANQEAANAGSNYLCGIGYEDLCRIRRELLGTTCQSLRPYADLMEKIAADASVCVVGGKEIVDKCESENLTIYTV